MGKLRRYGRVWRAFFGSCLAREVGYRVSFVMGVLRAVIWLALTLLNLEVVFAYTETLAGWNRYEMWLLAGVAGLARSVIAFFFGSNIERISSYIERGDMDYILLRPISSQFTSSFRYIQLYELPVMALNLGIMGYALSRLGRWPSPWQLVAFAVTFAAGLVILYALWLALATLSFWLVRQADNIYQLFDTLLNAMRYPVRIFPSFLQYIVTYLIPLAFVTVFPAQALSRGVSPLYPLGALLLAALAFYLSHRFWQLATRFYASASS